MTETELAERGGGGFTLIPLVRTVPADLDTPLAVYAKLAHRPFSFLLESVQGGERFGRFSFVGLPARTRLQVTGYRVEVITEGVVVETVECPDPLVFVQTFIDRYKAAPVLDLPRFHGGLAGYFGYDIVRYIEPRLSGGWKPDDIGVPDILLLLTTELAVIDNLSGLLHLIVYVDPGLPEERARGEARLDELQEALRAGVRLPEPVPDNLMVPLSDMSPDQHRHMVERAKAYIEAGDVMQVVLSRRMRQSFETSALSLYRSLRRLNPSPYLFYYDFGEFQVVGASPEILVRLCAGEVTVRPIAGTRPRGKDPVEDEALARELLQDPKEIAEHLMLMDLGRNDVGRIAQTGSVEVTENMSIERYSHVMHIVSNVVGRLRPGMRALDVLRATFPAGTLSGAPKVRAMEIIDELESTRRGIYGGAVGYLGFDGNMDMAIAIRTAVIARGQLWVQSGGGIVADSVPEAEWQETVNKARAVVRAAELVQSGEFASHR
ncbi:anthranilate synthase component I [Ferrovum sp.]|jgi:anthranilate synthase, component I (EC 4.1.3.27)|uniref:anthranilate synthase component I n=1 Tax=Ferrovum sp. TaxID=2609467 RepID=UPI002617A37A|nr:anthranilate synthase component I [Ferrovum sp.]